MTVKLRPDAVRCDVITIACCDRGHIYVRMHDEEGAVVAYGACLRPIAEEIIGRLLDAVDGVGAAPCMGVNG